MTSDKESKWTLEELIDETKEQAAFHADMETSYYDSLYGCLLELKAYREINKVKENPTNGDMIKAIFPDVEVKEKNNGYEVYFGIGTAIQFFNHQWWNTPYKAESEDAE